MNKKSEIGLNSAPTIANQWEKYLECLPYDVTELEKNKLKLVFYGGAGLILLIGMEIANDDISQDDRIKILRDLISEFNDFSRSIKL